MCPCDIVTHITNIMTNLLKGICMRNDWKDVPSYEDYLQVTSDGKVRRKAFSIIVNRKKQTPYRQAYPSKEYSPVKSKEGYWYIHPVINRKRRKIFIHRLVGWAFVPGYKDGLCINHINGRKTDNRAENLEWITLAENNKHARETGLTDTSGERSSSAKLTSKQVRIIRSMLRKGVTSHSIANLLGLSPTTIYFIKTGVRWQSVT
jgi:hypothetical protein